MHALGLGLSKKHRTRRGCIAFLGQGSMQSKARSYREAGVKVSALISFQFLSKLFSKCHEFFNLKMPMILPSSETRQHDMTKALREGCLGARPRPTRASFFLDAYDVNHLLSHFN